MAVSFLAENRTMQTIRARVAFHSRQHALDKNLQTILQSDQRPTGTQLAELYAYWGDPLDPADEQFLRSCVAETSVATGPVLLAGASLMTLILGAMCRHDDDRQLWCLESDRHWANLVRSWLTEHRISSAHVIQSQARLFGDYVWYSVDTGRLAKGYQLLICDGANATPKGVIGALQRMHNRLDSGFTILARNVKGDANLMRSLRDWAAEREATLALIDKQQGFIKLTRKASHTPAPPATPAPGTARPTGKTAQSQPSPNKSVNAPPKARA